MIIVCYLLRNIQLFIGLFAFYMKDINTFYSVCSFGFICEIDIIFGKCYFFIL